ncbi:MAG TPA: OmpA family protein [Gammaproteobacteria bacterium]
MPRKIFALLALFCSGFTASAGAGEARHDDDRYISLALNYADPDELRRVDGQGLGASFLYGFELGPQWFLEARLTGLILERGEAGGTDFYQQDLGVDALYRFGGQAGWQPFLLAGISAIRNDVDIESQDDVGYGVGIGGGVLSPPLGNLGLRFRLEARYVRDDFLEGMTDVRAGIGVQIPLGGGADDGAEYYGRGDEDSDSDGVGDYRDQCPYSLPYVKHDSSGCMLPDQTIRMYEVTFDNGTAILTAAARAELSALVLALRGQPDLQIRIDGHTDSWGGAEENRALSVERAEAVATHLTLQGVPTQRMTVRGFGETRPVESNATEAGRERNRRIEIVLLESPRP